MPLFAARHSTRGMGTRACLGRRKSASTIGWLRRRFVVERALHRHGQLVVLGLSHGCTLSQRCLHVVLLEPADRLSRGRLVIAIRPPLHGLQWRVRCPAAGCAASTLFAAWLASTLSLISLLHLFDGSSHRSAQPSSPPVIEQAIKRHGAANEAADNAAVHWQSGRRGFAVMTLL